MTEHDDRMTADVEESTVAELLARAALRDGHAWEELVRRYTPVVRARMRPYRLQEADQHDVAQTTWLKLAEHIGRLRTPEHLGGWLATVVSRECRAHHRRADRTATAGDTIDLTVPHPGTGPEQLAVDGDLARRVHRALAALPPARRELISALFAEAGPRYAEVSRRTGIPIGGIGPTRARALRQLHTMLAGQLVD